MSTNTQIMRKPLVLVAADDADQCRLIQEVLQQFGFRTEAAADAKSALKLFESEQPDAVLLDLNKSEKDNFRPAPVIRKHESGDEVPIFIVTDRDNDDAIEEAVSHWRDRYCL